MKEKLCKLIELKSIITLLFIFALVFIVIYLTLQNKFEISPDVFTGFVASIITYYFLRKQSTPAT